MMATGCCSVRLRSAQATKFERFPMEFDKPKVKTFIQQKQRQQNSAKKYVKLAFGESSQLKRYSKSLFEYALSKTTNESGMNVLNCIARPRSDTYTSVSRTYRSVEAERNVGLSAEHPGGNGPTRNGSVLYNKRIMILNDIRTQPPSKYSDDLHSSPWAPKLPIPALSSRVRIAESSLGGLKSADQYSDFSDIVFVPEENSTIGDFLASAANIDDHINETKQLPVDTPKITYRKPSIPVLVQIDAPDSSDSGSGENGATNINRLSDRRPSSRGSSRSITSAKSASNKATPAKTRKKSASVSRETGKGKLQDSLRPVSPNSSTSSKRPSSSGRDRGKAKLAVAERATKSKPGVKPDKGLACPNRLQLPGPRCWVDDITVSSDQFGCAESGVGNLAGNSPMEFGGRVFPKNGFTNLPGFLCPSSELKSRHVATKRWLRKCSFFSANRTLPLL